MDSICKFATCLNTAINSSGTRREKMIQEGNAVAGTGPQSPRGVYRHKIGYLKG